VSAGPQVAVGAVVTDAAGRVLLIQRGHAPAAGRWTIPGGRVERGETLAQALHRELAAETGITATLGPLVEVFEFIDADFHYVILDYRMSAPQGTPRAGEDAVDVRYFSLDEIGRLPTTQGLLEVLRRVLAS
jgi:8-oxo-dGTP diphosphatase